MGHLQTWKLHVEHIPNTWCSWKHLAPNYTISDQQGQSNKNHYLVQFIYPTKVSSAKATWHIFGLDLWIRLLSCPYSMGDGCKISMYVWLCMYIYIYNMYRITYEENVTFYIWCPKSVSLIFSWNITQLLTRQWYRLISKPIWGKNILALTWKKWILPTDDLPFNGDWFMGIMCSKSLFFVHVPTNRYVGSRQFSNIRKSWWFVAMGTPVILWKQMFQLNVPSLLKWEQKSCASAHVARKNQLWKKPDIYSSMINMFFLFTKK